MKPKASNQRRTAGGLSVVAYTGLIIILWLVLSGHYTPLLLWFGVISCTFVVFLTWNSNFFNGELRPEQLFVEVPVYWIWLGGEILKSNIATAKAIWLNKFDPEIFSVKATQKNENGLANYANSITLTPGTVTVSINENIFLVHALTAEMGDDVRSGTMDKKVTKLAL
jgi:multicomponent Na+:H+ antiporter subunit E